MLDESEHLHTAVLQGNLDQVRRILQNEKVNVNERDSHGNTPLLLAICIHDKTVYNTIVEMLIEKKADVNVSNHNITPLYNAVFYGREESVGMLLKAGADINQVVNILHIAVEHEGVIDVLLNDDNCTEKIINHPGEDGKTLLRIAAERDNQSCLKKLILKGADLTTIREDDKTDMDVIFEEVSQPVQLMHDVFDSCIHLEKKQKEICYYADFDILAADHSTKQTDVFSTMLEAISDGKKIPDFDVFVAGHSTRQMGVISTILDAASDEEKTELLQHPLIELYLTIKWFKICCFFYFWIIAYALFVLSLSVYVTALTHRYKMLDGVLKPARYVLIVSATCLLCQGLLQCWLTGRNHFRKYELWLNITSTFLALIVAIVELCTLDKPHMHSMSNWVLHTTSIAVLLSWTVLMLLIGRLPAYGYYALMFSAVLQNVIRVLSTFLCLVVGFALSFSIQFYHYEQFSDPWRALVKTTVMMMGEFEYADLFADQSIGTEQGPPTSRVMFLMFIILTSIVLMNLMVGLAVSDIQSLQVVSHTRQLEKQADFLHQFEKIVTSERFKSKYIPVCIKALLTRNYVDAKYELKTSRKFRRSRKLSSKLIDSLQAIAKSNRKKNVTGGKNFIRNTANELLESNYKMYTAD